MVQFRSWPMSMRSLPTGPHPTSFLRTGRSLESFRVPRTEIWKARLWSADPQLRSRALLRELPAHDAHEGFDRGIVEVRLQPNINRRPMARAHFLVDDPRHCEICHTGRSQRYTGPGGNQTHDGWPLRSLLDDIWPEPFRFTAGESPIESKGSHSPREKYKRLVSKISGTNCEFAGKFVTSREHCNESFSQD